MSIGYRLSYTAQEIDNKLKDIENKQDKLDFDSVPTEGSDNLINSGDIYTALQNVTPNLKYDETPTQGSQNLITSGGVYTALQNVNSNVDCKVLSVNGQTGIVNLDAEDVGALPNTTTIPTKVTDLTDEDNYYTKSEINSSLSTKQNIQTISLKGNTGSETWYYPLGKMVIDNSGNYGNYIFNGRFGGWVNNNSATYSIMLMNRGAYDGNSITSTVSAAGVYDAAISIVDIVVSKNDDLSHDVYLACTGYYLFDFAWTAFQHEITYNGTYTTTTPSNIIWRLSTAPKTILNSSGKFSASGGITVSASDITSGTLSTARGGTGYSSIVDTTYTTARYRASSLNSTETNPSDNGVIAWTYE